MEELMNDASKQWAVGSDYFQFFNHLVLLQSNVVAFLQTLMLNIYISGMWMWKDEKITTMIARKAFKIPTPILIYARYANWIEFRFKPKVYLHVIHPSEQSFSCVVFFFHFCFRLLRISFFRKFVSKMWRDCFWFRWRSAFGNAFRYTMRQLFVTDLPRYVSVIVMWMAWIASQFTFFISVATGFIWISIIVNSYIWENNLFCLRILHEIHFPIGLVYGLVQNKREPHKGVFISFFLFLLSFRYYYL